MPTSRAKACNETPPMPCCRASFHADSTIDATLASRRSATLPAISRRSPGGKFLSSIGTLPITDRKSRGQLGAVHGDGVVAALDERLAVPGRVAGGQLHPGSAAMGVVVSQ